MNAPKDAAPAPTRPVPNANDPLYDSYLAGLKEGRILVPFESRTGRKIWPPRDLAPGSLEAPDQVAELPPRGIVYSYITCNRAFHPWFKTQIPYVILLVELEPGLRMYGNLVGGGAVRIGAPVRAVFTPVGDAVVLDWTLEDGEDAR